MSNEKRCGLSDAQSLQWSSLRRVNITAGATGLPASELLIEGHTKTHGCTLLVWFEVHDDLQEARRREPQIKKWKRSWKVRLIEESNPDWRDLWFDIRQSF